MLKYNFIFLIAIFAFSLAGCSTESGATYHPSNQSQIEASAQIVITSRFGQIPGQNQAIDIDANTSIMAALQQMSDVETKYGGGFVHDINEVRSEYGDNMDWLVYVNGIQTRTGASDYQLLPGNMTQWDFHDWRFRMFTPAIIGAFPRPFLYGYDGKVYPTTIVSTASFTGEADALATKLQESGVEQISTALFKELDTDTQNFHNLILIADMDSELITELNDIWDRMGFFVHFENHKLVVFDGKGKRAYEFDTGTGVIQATQNPWNLKGIGACENVVWMISGTDEAGVKVAVDALLNRSDKLKHAFAAVVTSDEILVIPPID